MKKTLLLSLVLMTLTSLFNVHAQSCYNSYNSQIGKIESDGTIRDRYNSTVGKFESNGTVRDRYNSTLGKVEKDGTIRNRYNSSIGKASNVNKNQAGVYFFFFDEMNK